MSPMSDGRHRKGDAANVPFSKIACNLTLRSKSRLHAQPLLRQEERAIFMNTYAGSFVITPTAILHSSTLSPSSKTLYGILKSHSRQRHECFPSYNRLCKLMNRCENTVRGYMRELIHAGLVEQTRRGLRKSNIYRLIPIYPIGIGQTAVPEPQFLRSNKMSLETRREKFDGIPSFPSFADNADESSPACEGIAEPLPHAIEIFTADCSKEFRDSAVKSTQTRVARLFSRSATSPKDFYNEMQAARKITRARFGKIKKRNRQGNVLPLPYFLAVLQQRVLGERPKTPPQTPRMPSNDAKSCETDLPTHLYVSSRTEAYGETYEEFWRELREQLQMPELDLREYCRITGRPPIKTDIARSLSIFRDAKRKKRIRE